MDTQPELDDAIDVALGRTLDAQVELSEALRPHVVPEPALADRVVHRAEDLHALADEASTLPAGDRGDNGDRA